MKTTETAAISYAPVAPVVRAASRAQAVGLFISHLVAVALVTALGAAIVTVALLLVVVLAPVFLVVVVQRIRHQEAERLSRAAMA